MRSVRQPSSSVNPDAPVVTEAQTRRRPTTSPKFKLARSPPILETSSPATPVSHTLRSSPKLPSSPSVVERPLTSQFAQVSLSPSPTNPTSRMRGKTPQTGGMDESKPTSTAQFPMVVESPSFRPPVQPKYQESTVIASHPYSPDSDQDASNSSRRLNRPPVVMSSIVRESNGVADKTNPGSQRRVSRFMTERS